jgi:hypothetical protein
MSVEATPAPVASATPAATVEAVQIDSSAALAALSDADRATWRKTGEMPKADAAPAPAAKPAEAAPAPVDEAAKPEAEAAAPGVSKRQQQINDLIRRATVAEQEAAQLRDQVARGAQPAGKPAEAPAAPATAADPSDPKPTVDAFDTYEEYVFEAAKWTVRQEQRAAHQAAQAHAAHAEFTQRMSGWAERHKAFAASNPAYIEKAQPFLDRVFPGTPIGDVLADSPVGPQLALHLAEHLDEAERIARLHPIHALRELGKLEAKFENVAPAASAAPAPVKAVSDAPVPPTTLGTGSAEPADAIEAAVARKDFRAYAAEANRQELAARR